VARTVNVVLDPAGDEDGDGVTNGAELAAGTSPNDANSHPEFFAYRFTFRGPAGRWSYQGAVFSNPGDQATVTGRIYGLMEGTSAAKRIVIETVSGDVNLGMIYGGPNPVEIIPVHALRNSFTITNGQLTGVDFAYTYNSSGTFESDFPHNDYVPGNQALNLSLSAGSLSFGSMSAYGQIDVSSNVLPVFQKIAPETDFTFDPNSGTITGYSGPGGELVIPASIGGVAVTKIGDKAFQSKSNLSAVIIPNGVTTIGVEAFAGCSGMTGVTLPNSLTNIGNFAFQVCGNLGSIIIPEGVASLGANAFESCSGLTSITLPTSLKNIGSGTFYFCTNLVSVIFGGELQTIGDWAFGHCYKLKSISIPNSVTSLGNGSLSDCVELESVVLGSQLQGIGRYTFANDYKLTNLTIPASVTSIGEQAFSHCIRLATVNFQQNMPPAVNADSFMDVANAAMGYYPATAVLNWAGVTYSGITLRSNDQVAPVINLIGANELTIYKGTVFTDLGAIMTDNVDATRTIAGSGTVNTATVGVYTLTYTATDASGNLAAQVTRVVSVVLNPAGDEDGDGATNEVELTIGTNPYDSASGPYQPVAFGDAFTAKLASGMTTKVTSASLISNDKYSGISGETRGVTFVSASATSQLGGTIQVKGGWLIYRPPSGIDDGNFDTFTYTVTNGTKTATGTVSVFLVKPDYVAQVAIDRVSGDKVYFSVMPGMTFEVQGASQLGTSPTWITIVGPVNGNWTSGADGRLIVTDPAAVGAATRFYRFRWIP
jgi:hypothetical protein